jgi:outer membrane protein assembly factor BamB
MRRTFLCRILIVIMLNASFQSGYAENWPCWRGPRGDGTSLEKNLPVQWDPDTHVLWKTPVPGIGHASPIVWEDRVFTATALPETQERLLLCWDRKTGAPLWQRTVLKVSLEKKHNDNSYASGTPATDGKSVYISFLDGTEAVVAAYNFEGEQVWLQRPGTFSSPHGYSCSPVLYQDKVIINGCSKEESFAAALNCKDGQTVWKIAHDKPALSYSTPLIRPMAGRMQMIFCGNQGIAGINPENGSRYWVIDGPSEEFCSSPVYNEQCGMLFVSSSWPERHLLAIRPDGTGNVTESHISWRTEDGAYYVPSPVCVDGYLLTTTTGGEVYCFDAAGGTVLWKEKLGRQYSSPVTADGLVSMPNDEGVITVFKPGPVYERISRNPIGEKMNASPAISQGQIFIRGEKHLFCIGQPASSQ